MIALLLLAVLVLVLLNGFFVAAEFALVRSRKAHLQTDADAGQARRGDRGRDDGRPLALPVGGAGRDHAHLAGPRLPRRAGDRLAARGPVRRGGPALDLDDGLDRARVPDHDVDPHHASASRSRRSTRSRRPSRSPAGAPARCCCSRGSSTRSSRCSTPPPTASCVCSACAPSGQLDEGETPEELRVLIQESLTGGKLDAERGRDADRRLPPARAAGAPGDDARAGRDHGRHVRGRRDRAAPLRVVRPHAAGGHRGREPRPRQGHRALQPARAAAARRGPERDARRARARGADRARDQAARRPAGRPAALSAPRWRS